MDWLKHQRHSISQSEAGEASALTLHETIEVSHIAPSSINVALKVRFSVSPTLGIFGIASGRTRPSLSVVHPDTDKSPLIMSTDKGYVSTVFMKVSDKEYLAAVCKVSVYLWDTEKCASSVAYKFDERSSHSKMNLCVIDKTTVACGEVNPSAEGFCKICILNTERKKWKLMGTILVEAKSKITDMCYMKTPDGTSCLLTADGSLVQAVEMIGGKVRWRVVQQEMGKRFHPWSICTDGTTVFAADPTQFQLHLLSVEDGTVLTSISLHPFVSILPYFVRLRGEHLYVGHLNISATTYCISKFTKPTGI